MNQQLQDLEVLYMHLEREVADLNDVICRQQHTIERLESDLKALKEQFLLVAPSLARTTEEEDAPPHY